MRWEDERYVRFYTRDTPEWLALSWRARGLMGLILRAVDRAGVLVVGKLGKRGVAVAVHAPWVEVEGALAELLEDGCLVWDEERAAIFMPNYLPAQECAQSDAARKRASREKARAMFGGGSEASEKARAALKSQAVTACGPETGHVGVTNGHAESHAVTLSSAVPSRAVPNQETTPRSPPQEPGGQNGTVLDLKPEERPSSKLRPPRLKTRKRHSAANVTLRQELRFREDEKRDQRSKALFAWLESERQGAKVLDVAKDELARLPGREPSREEQIAFVQEKCAATVAEAEDTVALVEAAQMAAKGIEKREAGHA